MTSLEQAFTHTEQSADAALKSAQSVVTAARALSKAAKQGDFARMKSSMARLDGAVNALGEATDDALDSWAFEDGDEAIYLEEEYKSELLAAARDKGLQMYERDGNLIAYPSIVRILPSDRAVRVDRKKVSAIRPSGLVDQLLKNQQKPLRVSTTFLNALYKVYSELVGDSGMVGGAGRVVPLARVYGLLTALPGNKPRLRPQRLRKRHLHARRQRTKTDQKGRDGRFPVFHRHPQKVGRVHLHRPGRQ